MTDLSESTDSLKRVVAPPGRFASLYPEATEDDLAAALLDGLAEAQLEGFYLDKKWDDSGEITPDMSQPEIALTVIYAGIRFVRADLLQRNTMAHYKAGPVESETQQGASVMVAVLKDLADQKKQILTRLALIGTSGAFYMADMYVQRQLAFGGWFGQPSELNFGPGAMGDVLLYPGW